MRLPGDALRRVAQRVARCVEGLDGVGVDGDVVGVAVAAGWVEGDDHLWPQAAQDAEASVAGEAADIAAGFTVIDLKVKHARLAALRGAAGPFNARQRQA